jgi:hypothetical protein
MRIYVIFILSFFIIIGDTHAGSPVFRNPGLPDEFSLMLRDRIDPKTGWVTAHAEILKFSAGGNAYYKITSTEGDLFRTVITIKADDLTTVSEKRYDVKTGECIESFENNNGAVAFYNKEKDFNKKLKAGDHNVYSRYAYFISFMGFPFELKKEVSFTSYMFEYGDALTMKLRNTGKRVINVKAGQVECYRLELSVGGWQSIAASDRYYLYFSTEKPHYFMKYEQKEDDGKWYANELVSIREEKNKKDK